MLEVKEGIQMLGYKDPSRNYTVDERPIGDCLLRSVEKVEAGMGVEPNGFSYMNYVDKECWEFHPYNGSHPVPCTRPTGYHTTPTKIAL